MLLTAQMSTEATNEAIKSGSLRATMEAFMKNNQPEAAYFGTEDGRRTAFFVLDLKDSSEMPRIAEPLFMELGAKIQFRPVMNPEELARGLDAIERR
ncbi:hypothetical protein [Kitasatospora sp. NPDC050543]|uniref:hypothetical protein n=1 Tax=Kitasatospora sp. NPDC050543 TaxID=3364054 RepID=UPI00379BAEF8